MTSLSILEPAPQPNERSTAVVEVAELTKTYGDHRAVDRLSFRVERGEIFGVLGSNGAGKTTAVECVQGLRRADSGFVRVLSCDPIAQRSELRGRVGSQLQDSNLPDRLRVREALQLFADDRSQVDEALNDWDLGPLARSSFGDLSGGQRQRLFLALALLNKPEIVFFDELTQGLDLTARRDVWRLIEEVRDRGTTVILVTHFMEEAEVLCDRVVVVVGGQMVDEGTPAELIQRHSLGNRMRFAGTAADLAWVLATPHVVDASVAGHEIEVVGATPMIAHLGAAMVERQRVPDCIRMDQPSLEDALLELITPQGVQS